MTNKAILVIMTSPRAALWQVTLRIPPISHATYVPTLGKNNVIHKTGSI